MSRPAFRFRIADKADLPHLLALVPDGLRLDPAKRRRLPMLWGRLLDSEAKVFCVIEDLERPYPDRLEAFGLSVFVTDRFADDFCTDPQPYFPKFFYERGLAGEQIVLSSEQLREANAANGINIAVLHFGLRRPDISDPRTAEALKTGSAAFFFFHMGYKVRVIINEVYSAGHRDYMNAGGFHLLRDFHADSPSEFVNTPPDQYPYLFTLRREHVAPGAVNPLSQMFESPAPRLGFSRVERQLLERALLNETDAQIAENAGVSTDAVKKTWANIYLRVAREAPFLFPGAVPSSGLRGQEKRRHLLEYARMHLEELRPGRPADSASGRRRA